MDKQDWPLTEKKVCNGCAAPVENSFFECRQLYHESCFTCSSCQSYLLGAKIFLKSGQFTCGQCYLGNCCKCGNGLAEQTYLQVDNDHKYHVNCFRCEVCAKQLDKFIIKDDKCYCIQDYLQQFWQCFACKKTIAAPDQQLNPVNPEEQDSVQMQYICFESHKFHLQCFVCNFCKKPLEEVDRMSRNVFIVNGKRCCKKCVFCVFLKKKSEEKQVQGF